MNIYIYSYTNHYQSWNELQKERRNITLIKLTIREKKYYTRGTKDTKGTVKLINLKQTDNAMAKNEKDKQTTVIQIRQNDTLDYIN